jgi:hypothetical protein
MQRYNKIYSGLETFAIGKQPCDFCFELLNSNVEALKEYHAQCHFSLNVSYLGRRCNTTWTFVFLMVKSYMAVQGVAQFAST